MFGFDLARTGLGLHAGVNMRNHREIPFTNPIGRSKGGARIAARPGVKWSAIQPGNPVRSSPRTNLSSERQASQPVRPLAYMTGKRQLKFGRMGV